VIFDIQPYCGSLPIAFGMSRRDIHRLLGTPNSSHRIWDNSGISDNYEATKICVGYDNDEIVNHVGFSPGGCALSILEQSIWTTDYQPDPNPLLLSLDSEPVEIVGYWLYLRIGVSSTGYHDDDPGQRALSVFPRNAKNELLDEAVLADTSRYRRAS
jgi:hypothetical protein